MPDFIRSPITIAAIGLSIILAAVVAITSWIDSIPVQEPISKIIFCDGKEIGRLIPTGYVRGDWISWREGDTRVQVRITDCQNVRIVPVTE